MAISDFEAVRKPRWRIIAGNIYHNFSARWSLARGRLDSDIGSTHRHLTTEQSVEYINRVYRDYLAYGPLTPADLQGKRVLELGPGDNLGVALRLYSAGAAQVCCVDKFYSRRDLEQQVKIYTALRECLTPEERVRYDNALSLGKAPEFNPECVKYVPGCSAEDIEGKFGAGYFDLVVSRAVLWEVHAIDEALDALDRVTRVGGKAIHKIACLDWMFRQDGYHPLEFLTVPESLYRLMARHSGKSNRRTIDYYRNKMRELGYEATFQITRTVGAEGEELPPGITTLERDAHFTADTEALIRKIRPRLQTEFRHLSDQDLMVEDMFLTATKLR